VAQRWHQFLIYIAYNIAAFIINALMNSVLPYVTKAACKNFCQCFMKYTDGISHLVPHRIFCHLYYGAGMRVAELQLWKVRILCLTKISDPLTESDSCSRISSMRQAVCVDPYNDEPKLTDSGPDGVAWLLGVRYFITSLHA
jgi:hypothetical protein